MIGRTMIKEFCNLIKKKSNSTYVFHCVSIEISSGTFFDCLHYGVRVELMSWMGYSQRIHHGRGRHL